MAFEDFRSRQRFDRFIFAVCSAGFADARSLNDVRSTLVAWIELDFYFVEILAASR
jgi:hypothetical protein